MGDDASATAVVSVGDQLKVYWSKIDETQSDAVFQVIKIKKSDKLKDSSWFTYTLQNVEDPTDVRKTRLLSLKYKLKGIKKRKHIASCTSETLTNRILPDFTLILAPMVSS